MKHTLKVLAGASLALVMVSSCAKKDASTMTDSTTAATTTPAAGASNSDANIAGVRMFYDSVINAHNVAASDKYCAANVVDHNPEMGHSGQGLDDMKAEFTQWFAMMPDVHVTVDQMFGSGDMVCTISKMSGTVKGHNMMNPGDDKKVQDITSIDIIKLKDGKCVERWGLDDARTMMMQLGLMPPPGGAPGGPGDMGKKKGKG